MAGLDPQQRAVALQLIALAESKGLTPARAREFAAAAYSESGLRRKATNKSSGAAGLFQLLSSGYRTRAQQLGGLYDVRANALAILPNYISYWRGHPKAAPGDAGRDVELSGEGSGFYSKGLPLIPQDGSMPVPPSTPLHPEIASMIERHRNPDMGMEALSGLQAIAQGSYDPMKQVGGLLEATRAAAATPEPQGRPQRATKQPSSVPGPVADLNKFVTVSPGADRKGVPTHAEVLDFVGRIGQIAGTRLTIGTGSNHHQYVSGEGNTVSDHWYGEAADIPAAGAQLTKLGQDALIAAGMPAAQARKQTGGVFNVNGYNILFNTHVGGNHYNHLHVGLGRIIGRPR